MSNVPACSLQRGVWGWGSPGVKTHAPIHAEKRYELTLVDCYTVAGVGCRIEAPSFDVWMVIN